uniref:Nudix hydrolase 25-like n=1 Tax=Populus alba TaxID=43335 RepID=A0A4U5M5T1_POPAL|nr:nudix hydrolase 25-like [Populus alba]
MDGLPSGYRPNVGVCLINSDNLVFVASRLNVPGAWQMPQGGIEDGEEPKSAAIRELMEETGIVSAEIVAEVPNWLTYDFPPAVKAKVNRLWGGEWHGQAQKWFLMRLTKDESEINLASGEADPEFAEWKWASPEEVIEQAVDYKRPTYEEVMRTFRPYLNENGIAAKLTKTNILKEQLLEFSLFWRGVHVPEDDNLGSMVEIKREESLEDQGQLKRWENSVITEHSQPREQKIDIRAKMPSCCDAEGDGEGDGVVNLRAPFLGSSFPFLAKKKARRAATKDQRGRGNFSLAVA